MEVIFTEMVTFVWINFQSWDMSSLFKNMIRIISDEAFNTLYYILTL